MAEPAADIPEPSPAALAATEPTPADPPAPKKRGPKTPEGKARSAMNALKHGLRARRFGLLPGEAQAEWAEHLAELHRSLRPRDPFERKLVESLAVALWKEIRADAQEAEALLVIPPKAPGRPHGADLARPERRAALATAARYQAMAGNAVRRALAALIACRAGRLEAATAVDCTNELPAPAASREECTNELAAEPLPGVPLEPPPPEPEGEEEGEEAEAEAFELPVVEADPEREEARRAILRSWLPGEQRRFAHCRLTDLERHQAIKDPDPTAYEAWFARQPKPPAERVPLSAEEKAQIAWVTRHNPPWLRGEYLGYYRPPVPKEAFGLDGDGIPSTGSGAQGEPAPAPEPANDALGESPVAALRARILRLLDRTAPRQPEELDLAEAICSLKWPKWPEYRGSIDLWRLRRALEGVEIDSRALYWLGSQELEKACKQARAP